MPGEDGRGRRSKIADVEGSEILFFRSHTAQLRKRMSIPGHGKTENDLPPGSRSPEGEASKILLRSDEASGVLLQDEALEFSRSQREILAVSSPFPVRSGVHLVFPRPDEGNDRIIPPAAAECKKIER